MSAGYPWWVEFPVWAWALYALWMFWPERAVTPEESERFKAEAAARRAERAASFPSSAVGRASGGEAAGRNAQSEEAT